MNVRAAPALIASMLAAGLVAQQDKAARARLEQLVEQLAGDDASARSQAYNVLIRERDPQVVALLDKRIDAMPEQGQQLALYLLQQHPIELTRDVHSRLCGSVRAALRAHAAAMLVRNGDRSRLPTLAKAVAAAPSGDRSFVLNALWSIEDADVAAAVRGYVAADAPVHVTVSSLQHLWRMEHGATAATEAAARGLLAAADDGVRAAGLAWLVGCGRGDGVEAHATELAKLLAAEPERFWTVERLLQRERKYPVVLGDAFVAALGRPRSRHDVDQILPLVRSAAPDRVAATLRTLLTHGNDDVRSAAIAALAILPGGLQPAELRQLLQNGQPEQRLAVAAVLRRMDDPSGLPVVLALCREPGKHRAEALRVLGGFRSREIVPPLLDALDDADRNVRHGAWSALQPALRDLFPYRRFDFAGCGYDPDAASRAAGIATLRAWWAAAR